MTEPSDAEISAIERKRKKAQAYRDTFTVNGRLHPNALIVIQDLFGYCGVNKEAIVVSPSTQQVDPYATCYRGGRKDVFERIRGFIQLDEDISDDSRDKQPVADTGAAD